MMRKTIVKSEVMHTSSLNYSCRAAVRHSEEKEDADTLKRLINVHNETYNFHHYQYEGYISILVADIVDT